MKYKRPWLGSTRHFAMKCYVAHNQLLFQHECSHLFGATDWQGWALWPICVMGWSYDSWTSVYCDTCARAIHTYRYRFETISDPKHITILASTGGGTDPPDGEYVTNGNPRITAYPSYGWALFAWEISIDGGVNWWTEPPWNPVDVIYDYATIRPQFIYLG